MDLCGDLARKQRPDESDLIIIFIIAPLATIRNYIDLHEVLAYRGTSWSDQLVLSRGPVLLCWGCFGWFVGLGFVLFRAGNAFWSLLLQLATQVRVPGAGDAAST